LRGCDGLAWRHRVTCSERQRCPWIPVAVWARPLLGHARCGGQSHDGQAWSKAVRKLGFRDFAAKMSLWFADWPYAIHPHDPARNASDMAGPRDSRPRFGLRPRGGPSIFRLGWNRPMAFKKRPACGSSGTERSRISVQHGREDRSMMETLLSIQKNLEQRICSHREASRAYRPDPDLNSLVQVAAFVCGTFISLVSLVGPDLHRFKA
jgi:hypothetical protein